MNINDFSASGNVLDRIQAETVGVLFDEIWDLVDKADHRMIEDFLRDMDTLRTTAMAEGRLIIDAEADQTALFQRWTDDDVVREVICTRRRQGRSLQTSS